MGVHILRGCPYPPRCLSRSSPHWETVSGSPGSLNLLDDGSAPTGLDLAGGPTGMHANDILGPPLAGQDCG